MRRLSLVLALAAALVAAALPAGAAPHNGNSATEIEVDCGEGGTFTVLVQNRTSSVAVFDAALESNGRKYVLSSLDDRIYLGEFDDEPAGDPDLQFLQTWGERRGYSERLTCTGGPVPGFDASVGPFTEFFDVVVSGK